MTVIDVSFGESQLELLLHPLSLTASCHVTVLLFFCVFYLTFNFLFQILLIAPVFSFMYAYIKEFGVIYSAINLLSYLVSTSPSVIR